jgi:hypothetical protein
MANTFHFTIDYFKAFSHAHGLLWAVELGLRLGCICCISFYTESTYLAHVLLQQTVQQVLETGTRKRSLSGHPEVWLGLWTLPA